MKRSTNLALSQNCDTRRLKALSQNCDIRACGSNAPLGSTSALLGSFGDTQGSLVLIGSPGTLLGSPGTVLGSFRQHSADGRARRAY